MSELESLLAAYQRRGFDLSEDETRTLFELMLFATVRAQRDLKSVADGFVAIKAQSVDLAAIKTWKAKVEIPLDEIIHDREEFRAGVKKMGWEIAGKIVWAILGLLALAAGAYFLATKGGAQTVPALATDAMLPACVEVAAHSAYRGLPADPERGGQRDEAHNEVQQEVCPLLLGLADRHRRGRGDAPSQEQAVEVVLADAHRPVARAVPSVARLVLHRVEPPVALRRVNERRRVRHAPERVVAQAVRQEEKEDVPRLVGIVRPERITEHPLNARPSQEGFGRDGIRREHPPASDAGIGRAVEPEQAIHEREPLEFYALRTGIPQRPRLNTQRVQVLV